MSNFDVLKVFKKRFCDVVMLNLLFLFGVFDLSLDGWNFCMVRIFFVSFYLMLDMGCIFWLDKLDIK